MAAPREPLFEGDKWSGSRARRLLRLQIVEAMTPDQLRFEYEVLRLMGWLGGIGLVGIAASVPWILGSQGSWVCVAMLLAFGLPPVIVGLLFRRTLSAFAREVDLFASPSTHWSAFSVLFNVSVVIAIVGIGRSGFSDEPGLNVLGWFLLVFAVYVLYAPAIELWWRRNHRPTPPPPPPQPMPVLPRRHDSR